VATSRHKGMGSLAREVIPEIQDIAEEVGLELHKALHRTLLHRVRSTTPVGKSRPGRPNPKHGRDSWGSVIGAGVIGGGKRGGNKQSTDAVLRSLKPGVSTRVVASSPVFNLIDKGRRMTKKIDKRRSFLIGSPRAPRGITKPALSNLESRRDAITRAVIKKAGG